LRIESIKDDFPVGLTNRKQFAVKENIQAIPPKKTEGADFCASVCTENYIQNLELLETFWLSGFSHFILKPLSAFPQLDPTEWNP
jgi:hypothetical protein